MCLLNADIKRSCVERYLTSLHSMAKEMRLKEERIARLRSLAEGLRNAVRERITGGVGRDLADIEHELNELSDEYVGDLARYAAEIAEGYRICPTSNPPRYACWLHWAENKTWAETAKKVGYSCEYVKREMRDQGVCEIYEEMPHHWRTPSLS